MEANKTVLTPHDLDVDHIFSAYTGMVEYL
jgi:hypothetical protein